MPQHFAEFERANSLNENACVPIAELCHHLTARTTWHVAGWFSVSGGVQARNGDVRQALTSSSHGGEDGDTLGADRQAKRGILDVAANKDLAVCQDCNSDGKARIGTVSVCSRRAGGCDQVDVSHGHILQVQSVSQLHVFQEGGKAVKIFPRQACRLRKSSKLVSRATVEVLGLPPLTAGTAFDERAFPVKLLRFFMENVVDVPRLSGTSAYHIHGVFLHASDS